MGIKLMLLLAAVVISVIALVVFLCKKISHRAFILTIFLSFSAAIVATALTSAIIEPRIVLNGRHSLTVPVYSEYTEEGYTAFLGKQDITDKVKVDGVVDGNTLGEYEVVYSVQRKGRTYRQTRRIQVVDELSPTITLSGDSSVTISSMKYYKEAGAMATDNYDGDITKNIEITKKRINDEKYEVIYTVTDSSGNKQTAVRSVTLKDLVSPVLTLKGKSTVAVMQNGKYEEAGATAIDDLDGNITADIVITGTVDTTKAGTYNVNYSVRDTAGNVTTLTRRVIVQDPEEAKNNRIYLTFDDGPSTDVTVEILDILKKNDIKATFFILDYSADELPVIKRIINDGHTIGIHGYSHDYAVIYKSGEAFMNNIDRLKVKLLNDTGYNTSIMRFPGGSSNTISNRYCKGIMGKLKKKMSYSGWTYFDWNVDSGDASGTLSADKIANNVISSLRKNRSNVVLMHDSSAKGTTADSLQKIIDYAYENNYSFWAIDSTTEQIKH